MISVCLYSDRFHPIVGGTELQAQRMARRLAGSGKARFLVLTRRHDPNWPAEEDIGGLRVFRLPPSGLNKWSELRFAFRSILFLLSHRREFEVIHFLLVSFPNALVAAVMKLAGKKVMFKIAGAGVLSRGNPLVRLVRNAILRRADAVIAVSGEIEREYRDHRFASRKIVSIPNGVDDGRFRPLAPEDKIRRREELGFPSRGTVLIYAGRISREKGPHLLVRAWRDVARDFPDAHLVLAGSGRLQEETVEADLARLLDAPEARDMRGRVLRVGEVPDLAPYLQAADLFVLPSLKEGLPNALLEAMAAGLPVVASRLPGVVEALGEGGAEFVVPGESESLARGIRAMLARPERLPEAGRKNRERVLQWYSLEKVADRYAALYSRLAGG